jgi:hypothetical protein
MCKYSLLSAIEGYNKVTTVAHYYTGIQNIYLP